MLFRSNVTLPCSSSSVTNNPTQQQGRVTFTVDGQEEVLEPGDAFYVPPGHLQRAEAGTEYLQFSPAKENAEVEQQIMKNMQAMQAQEG